MNLANGIRKGRSSATLSPLTVIWFLPKFCLIVLMWYIIKGRPESERIGGNTGSTANCVLSDICLIETADGDGTLNNVSMKDGCLWHLNVRKCYRKAYLNRMQIYKKVRKRTNLQRKDEYYGILCKSAASIYSASWLKEGSGVNNDRMKKPLHDDTNDTDDTEHDIRLISV